MTARRFDVVLEWDPESRVWVTYAPALNFLSDFGDTREEALEHTREAILGYLEAAARESIAAVDHVSSELVHLEVPGASCSGT